MLPAPLRRLLLPRDTRRTAADWDGAFADGRWDHLSGLPEMARTAVIAGYLRAAAPEAARVLDIGCGEGVLARVLGPQATYTGIDLSAVAIGRAQAGAGASERYITADAATWQPDAPYDAIVFNEVLYYFADIAAVVERYLAALAPGGVLVASVYRKRKTRRVWRELARVAVPVDGVTIAHGRTGWRVALLTPRRAS